MVEDESEHAHEEVSFAGDLAVMVFKEQVPLAGEGLSHESCVVEGGVVHVDHCDVGDVGGPFEIGPVEPS